MSTVSESSEETYEITLYNKCVNTTWPFKLLIKEMPDNIPKEKVIDCEPHDRKTIKQIKHTTLTSSIRLLLINRNVLTII